MRIDSHDVGPALGRRERRTFLKPDTQDLAILFGNISKYILGDMSRDGRDVDYLSAYGPLKAE
jgi:hypothetical protein